MKRINEAIAELNGRMTKGQRLLASFLSEHCDRAAFLNSFDLAAVSGVSQSTVMRFSTALGYTGYAEFQAALQLELKYRLTALERFELLSEVPNDRDLLDNIAAADARNIRKICSLNEIDAIKNLCARLILSSKVYIWGQGHAAAAAVYLASYLRVVIRNVCGLNLIAEEPLAALSDIGSGDLLLTISFPLHSEQTQRLISYAREHEASVVTISEGHESEPARNADISLICECGDFGVNGSLAPVISLCGAIVCLLAKDDERAQKKLRAAGEAIHFKKPEDA